jgi:hypothetical protein
VTPKPFNTAFACLAVSSAENALLSVTRLAVNAVTASVILPSTVLAKCSTAVVASTIPFMNVFIPPSPRTRRSHSALSFVIFFCIYKRVLIPFM